MRFSSSWEGDQNERVEIECLLKKNTHTAGSSWLEGWDINKRVKVNVCLIRKACLQCCQIMIMFSIHSNNVPFLQYSTTIIQSNTCIFPKKILSSAIKRDNQHLSWVFEKNITRSMLYSDFGYLNGDFTLFLKIAKKIWFYHH